MPIEILNIVDCADAGMVQLGGGASLPHKAVQELGVFRQVFGDELQGDVAAQTRILRLIHHPHAAPAKLAQNVIVGNSLADHP